MSRDEEAQIRARLKDEITKQLLAGIDEKVEAAYKRYQQAEEDRIAAAANAVLGKSRRATGGNRGRGPTIALDEKTCDKVFAVIKKHPESKAGDIRAKLPDLDARVVAKAIALLRKEKRVKMHGTRAAATYTAV